MGEDIASCISDDGLTPKIYQELITITIQQQKTPIQKRAEDLNKDIQTVNRHMKRCSTSLSGKCRSKLRDPTSHLLKWLFSKRQGITNCWGECREKGAIVNCWEDCNQCGHYGKLYGDF